MSHLGALSRAGALILLAASAALAAEPRARFLAPVDGDLIVGRTEIRFAVDSREPGIERIDVYSDDLLIGSARPPEWSLAWDAPAGKAVELVAAVYAAGRLVDKIRVGGADHARFVDVVDVVAVELFPVVTDARGRYVGGLTVDDFSVFDEGRPVQVESFSNEPAELSLAVLVDVSGSMEEKLGPVQTASSRFVDALGEHERAAVYAFNHGFRPEVELTTDRARVKAALRELRAGGGTALYDAIVEVLDAFRGVRGRKAVVLFSDGRDESSLTTQARAIEAARRQQVIIYTVGAGDSTADRDARDNLRILAEESGGSSHLIDRMSRLSQVFTAILEDLGAQYGLSYTAPGGLAGLRRVVVQPKDGALRIRYQKSYFFSGG